MTQFQLAARAGLSLQTVSIAERGGILTDRSVRLLAEALGVLPAELRP